VWGDVLVRLEGRPSVLSEVDVVLVPVSVKVLVNVVVVVMGTTLTVLHDMGPAPSSV
jgi:hypothetical protein